MTKLGIPAHAFDALREAPGKFSFIGMPGTKAGPVKSYSWTNELDQRDTGYLRGILHRNHAFQYAPMSTSSWDPNSLPSSSTPDDDRLAFAIADQIGSAAPSAWPLMNTPGGVAAYRYLSKEIVRAVYSRTGNCDNSIQVCEDVRFYYPGNQGASLSGVDLYNAGAYPMPTATQAAEYGFSIGGGSACVRGAEPVDDYCAAVRQLNAEIVSMNSVRNYQNWLADAYQSSQSSVAMALSMAANDTTRSMAAAFATEPPQTTPLQWAADSLNAASGLTSIFAAAGPLMGPAAGVFRLASAGISLYRDAQPVVPDHSDIKWLSDLTTGNQNQASQTAIVFSTELEGTTGKFFDGVYSDWFKLQTIGSLASDAYNPNWYIRYKGNSANAFLPILTAEARVSFYSQVLPTVLIQDWVTAVPTSTLAAEGWTQPKLDIAVMQKELFMPNYYALESYSWSKYTNPKAFNCTDYSVFIAKSSVPNGNYTRASTWKADLGVSLFGTGGVGSLGLGPLGLSRFNFEDSGIISGRSLRYNPMLMFQNNFCPNS
jgi:hypothetical protein